MHFDSVDQILAQLERQPGWEKFREYRQLLKCWHKTVNPNTAEHTRPLYITRQILWVATSSSARAQELSFQRYILLKRLNKQLGFTLKDIRFSDSQWHQTATSINRQDLRPIFVISDRQKSLATITPAIDIKLKTTDKFESSSAKAKQAARRWLKTLEDRNPSVFCPNCQAATPKEEIKRWKLCHHCVAQKWSKDYRPVTFSALEEKQPKEN